MGSSPTGGTEPASAPPGTGAFFMPGRRYQCPPAALLGHGFGLRDGCWNPVSAGGTDPPKVNTPASGDEESLIMSIQTRAASSQVAEYDFTSFHNEVQTQKPKALIIQKTGTCWNFIHSLRVVVPSPNRFGVVRYTVPSEPRVVVPPKMLSVVRYTVPSEPRVVVPPKRFGVER